MNVKKCNYYLSKLDCIKDDDSIDVEKLDNLFKSMVVLWLEQNIQIDEHDYKNYLENLDKQKLEKLKANKEQARRYLKDRIIDEEDFYNAMIEYITQEHNIHHDDNLYSQELKELEEYKKEYQEEQAQKQKAIAEKQQAYNKERLKWFNSYYNSYPQSLRADREETKRIFLEKVKDYDTYIKIIKGIRGYTSCSMYTNNPKIDYDSIKFLELDIWTFYTK